MRTEIGEGLRYVFGHPYLKNIAACTASFNFFGNVGTAVLLVYAVRVLDLRPAVIGLAFTIGNVGALVAAFTSGRISARLGVGHTIVASSIIGGPMFLVVAFAPHGNAALAVIGPAVAVASFTNVIYNVTQVSLRQTITPERIQGRMNAVMRFLVWGTIPLGNLIGGALGTWVGLKETLIIGGIGSCLPFLAVLFSPVRSIRDMPEPVDEGDLLSDPLLAETRADLDAGPTSHPQRQDLPLRLVRVRLRGLGDLHRARRLDEGPDPQQLRRRARLLCAGCAVAAGAARGNGRRPHVATEGHDRHLLRGVGRRAVAPVRARPQRRLDHLRGRRVLRRGRDARGRGALRVRHRDLAARSHR